MTPLASSVAACFQPGTPTKQFPFAGLTASDMPSSPSRGFTNVFSPDSAIAAYTSAWQGHACASSRHRLGAQLPPDRRNHTSSLHDKCNRSCNNSAAANKSTSSTPHRSCNDSSPSRHRSETSSSHKHCRSSSHKYCKSRTSSSRSSKRSTNCSCNRCKSCSNDRRRSSSITRWSA